jgi:glyoxylase-like metal-dependent hydrolase (beta-lactamase superfamily II)
LASGFSDVPSFEEIGIRDETDDIVEQTGLSYPIPGELISRRKTMRKKGWLMGLSSLLLVAFGLTVNAGAVLRLQKVNDNVYAVIGPFGNRTPENLGNNSTSGFVVTDEGVVLVDSGGTYRGAAAIEALIKQVTDKPVKVVINSGGQDHRWLGNSYFKARGAHIIASTAAVEDQRARTQDQLVMLGNLVGSEGMESTEPVYADETFEKTKRFTLGSVNFELHRVGPAHTPGDTLVWLPRKRIVFAGDVVFAGRMLGVLPHSSSRGWIEAFDAMARLEPAVVIPGHGPVTDLARARKDTYDYLAFLRQTVGAFVESGGSITETSTLNQARFDYLVDSATLEGRNAQQVYQEMEWE